MPPDSDRFGPRFRIGIDAVSVERLERLVEANPGALDELFTSGELTYAAGKRRRMEHLAGRFAAKEAVLKAIGTGLAQRMDWTDVEIAHQPGGRPAARLRGAVELAARRAGVTQLEISLTHTHGLAIAQALAVIDKALLVSTLGGR